MPYRSITVRHGVDVFPGVDCAVFRCPLSPPGPVGSRLCSVQFTFFWEGDTGIADITLGHCSASYDGIRSIPFAADLRLLQHDSAGLHEGVDDDVSIHSFMSSTSDYRSV